MAQRTVTLMRQQGQATLQWHTLRSSASKKRVIGVCEPMNLSIEADLLDELYSIIPETLNLMLFDLLADNELDAFLKEIGWQVQGAAPAPAANEDLRFHVPWELIIPGEMGGSKRRASQRA